MGSLRLIGSPDGTSPVQVSVDDLKRAWAEARHDERGFGDSLVISQRWTHPAGEQVVPVIGCTGSVGTTITSLALATASDRATRVVECCALTSSGLTAASDAELGTFGGWRRGLRGGTLLERSDADIWRPETLPEPSPFPASEEQQAGCLTILDLGWRAGLLLAGQSWMGAATCEANAVVIVASATVPGARQLERTLQVLGGVRCVAAMVGPRRRRWPSAVRAEIGPQTSALLETGRLVTMPADARLAVAGVSASQLPQAVLAAGRDLMTATRQLADQIMTSSEGDLR